MQLIVRMIHHWCDKHGNKIESGRAAFNIGAEGRVESLLPIDIRKIDGFHVRC